MSTLYRATLMGETMRAARNSKLLTCAVGIAFSLILAPSRTRSQELDPAKLLAPATDTWPTYNGEYSGRRYSTLDQINSKNVGSLTLAWAFRSHGHTLKSTPLEVNGVLYLTSPDNV